MCVVDDKNCDKIYVMPPSNQMSSCLAGYMQEERNQYDVADYWNTHTAYTAMLYSYVIQLCYTAMLYSYVIQLCYTDK